MKIIKSISENGNLLPEIIRLTNSIPESCLFNKDYLLRTPQNIAYRSIDRIIEAFHKIIEEYGTIEKFINKQNSIDNALINVDRRKLSDLVVELFESIISFIEDCFYIFKCTTPFDPIKASTVSVWLKKVKHPTSEEFYEQIKEYREDVAFFVNKIKHEHGRLKIMLGNNKDNFCIGYYIKNIEDTNKYENGNGIKEVLDLNNVKSLIPELKYHLFQIFRISENFTVALKKSLEHYYSISIAHSIYETNINNFNTVVEWLKEQKYFVFPNNEIITPKVGIQFDKKFLELEYPIGITESNRDFIIFEIKEESSQEVMTMLIPNEASVSKIKNMMKQFSGEEVGCQIESNNLQKVTIVNYSKAEQGNKSICVNYENLFTVESDFDIGFCADIIGGIDSNEMFIRIPEIDYLGLKIQKT